MLSVRLLAGLQALSQELNHTRVFRHNYVAMFCIIYFYLNIQLTLLNLALCLLCHEKCNLSALFTNIKHASTKIVLYISSHLYLVRK